MFQPAAITAQIIKAQHLQMTLGTRCAAGYLRNRQFSLEEALNVLVYKKAVV